MYKFEPLNFLNNSFVGENKSYILLRLQLKKGKKKLFFIYLAIKQFFFYRIRHLVGSRKLDRLAADGHRIANSRCLRTCFTLVLQEIIFNFFFNRLLCVVFLIVVTINVFWNLNFLFYLLLYILKFNTFNYSFNFIIIFIFLEYTE